MLALVAMPAALHAQAVADPGTDTGAATAEVVEPGTLTRMEDLRFGAFIQPSTSGTITIRPNGSYTATGELLANMSIQQPAEGRGPARFRLLGDDNRFFIVKIPRKMTITNGTSTMQITNMLANVRNGRIDFDISEFFSIYVGGTLNVGAMQEQGTYRGEFEAVVLLQ
ncbi:DUF4402 domain-containing protein [Aurantiacibacter spongiae]|uniref:DUF4402 domain-containing protein n=1 Tax=Aurantiacibacter spongiae TaxID=2488860 RepID=UPI0013152A3B|nr:DUF4402 domain-containing protein [Aurantiacibacter spongiae]